MMRRTLEFAWKELGILHGTHLSTGMDSLLALPSSASTGVLPLCVLTSLLTVWDLRKPGQWSLYTVLLLWPVGLLVTLSPEAGILPITLTTS